MAKKKNKKVVEPKQDDSKTYAFLATFLSIVGFLIALMTKKDDEYVMYYAKQSLVIFILAVVITIVNQILFAIPVIGLIVYWVLSLILLLIWILSWVYALSGEKKNIPIISDFANKFNF